MTDLREMADQVSDEAGLITFMKALAEDWYDERAKEAAAPPRHTSASGANGWESGSIGAFLDSAAAWAEGTSSGSVSYTRPDNSWRRCAHVLLMGKLYEELPSSSPAADAGTPRTPPS